MHNPFFYGGMNEDWDCNLAIQYLILKCYLNSLKSNKTRRTTRSSLNLEDIMIIWN